MQNKQMCPSIAGLMAHNIIGEKNFSYQLNHPNGILDELFIGFHKKMLYFNKMRTKGIVQFSSGIFDKRFSTFEQVSKFLVNIR